VVNGDRVKVHRAAVCRIQYLPSSIYASTASSTDPHHGVNLYSHILQVKDTIKADFGDEAYESNRDAIKAFVIQEFDKRQAQDAEVGCTGAAVER